MHLLCTKQYTKIVNVRDIAEIRDGKTQIVKFHGDFDDDTSLVITETDYFERLAFETPLDIKLRADAIGKTIAFIGYSLSDINMRLLLHKLWHLWETSGLKHHRPQSYILFSRPNPIQEAVLAQWGVHAIVEDVDDPKEALVSFLTRLLDMR